MKHRGLIAAGLAVALVGVAGCGSGGGSESGDEQPDSLTVWLMPDAKSTWPKALKHTNKKFEKKHPDVKVKFREQDWTKYLTKFDARLGSGDVPDVMEFGNTETAKYMANSALMDLSDAKSSFDNSDQWLDSLEKSCTYKGKLYCVPYYAAARGILYRADMFDEAGITEEPSSLAEYEQDMAKLKDHFGDDKNFSAFFFPGKYWYGAMAFVHDYGGQIAKREEGRWKGTLDSPQARQALSKLKEIVLKYSGASKTKDESKQPDVFAEGHVASAYVVSFDPAVITDEDDGNPDLKGKLGAFPMPSHTPGKTMPSMLGGSDLAIPAATDAPKLAKDWVRIYTSTKTMKMMVDAGDFLPNAKTDELTQEAKKGKTDVGKAFVDAGKNTWFVPTAKNWSTVEQRDIIPNMLVNIFTEKASVKQATKNASQQITETLNEG